MSNPSVTTNIPRTMHHRVVCKRSATVRGDREVRAGAGDIIRPHMSAFTSLPRPLLRFAAILFAAATVFYSALWMYYIRARPQAVIGIEYDVQSPEHLLRVTRVIEGSGAGAAGLQPGDLVRAIDGQPL